MRIFASILLVSLLVAASPAGAQITSTNARVAIAPEKQKCEMQTTGAVNINFNNLEEDVLKIKSALEGKTREIEALAKEAGVEQIEMQSLNYNANSQSSGGCGNTPNGKFQISGNINFNVKPADKAADFAVLLVNKGYSANFNVNAYRQCGNFAGGD